jgi:uncharacterized protein YjiS (DUF1127 family)
MTSWTGNSWTAMSAGLAACWRNMRAARERLGELDRCGGELERIARDVGVSQSELYTIAAKRPDAADQLKLRLEALHLDRAALVRDDPLVMRDLERVCTTCGSKRRCVRDWARFPDDAAWRGYCPNAMTFDALSDQTAVSGNAGDVDGGRVART